MSTALQLHIAKQSRNSGGKRFGRASRQIVLADESKYQIPVGAFLEASPSPVELASFVWYPFSMKPKKQSAGNTSKTTKISKEKAAESGVSAAQRVFGGILKKADPIKRQ